MTLTRGTPCIKLCSSKDSRNRAKQQTRQTRLYNNTTFIKILILIKLICCDREKLQVKKKNRAVLDFWTFDFHTTHILVHYKLSPLIHLPCAAFGPSYTANKQTFRVTAQSHSLSAKPTLQSLCSCSTIIICVHTVVFICYCKKFFEKSISQYALLFLRQCCVLSTYPHTHAPYILPVSPKLNFCVS